MVKSDRQWRKILTPEQYWVTRRQGTERPFTGKFYRHKEAGIYRCVCCGQQLFSSEAKYNSGSGWPSYFQPISLANVTEKHDDSHGMERVEVRCSRCDAHLGHLFKDGPRPSGLRYCINSASLAFTPAQKTADSDELPSESQAAAGR